VIKSSATQKHEVVTYMQAYRAIQTTVDKQAVSYDASFQLVEPYLEKFKETNKDSVVVCQNDEENCITYCFVCPGIMKKAMRFVRPVVGLDGCHIKSHWKGTL
jgi:hypothetical protein